MKKIAIFSALAGLACAFATTQILAQENAQHAAAPAKSKGELRLEKMLAGRVAGTPKSCIYLPTNADVTVIDGVALVYRSGNKLYVNTTHNPKDIDDDDVMVIRRFSSQLCRTDMITLVDRFSGFYSGNIFLGDFVPYTKAAS